MHKKLHYVFHGVKDLSLGFFQLKGISKQAEIYALVPDFVNTRKFDNIKDVQPKQEPVKDAVPKETFFLGLALKRFDGYRALLKIFFSQCISYRNVLRTCLINLR